MDKVSHITRRIFCLKEHVGWFSLMSFIFFRSCSARQGSDVVAVSVNAGNQIASHSVGVLSLSINQMSRER